MWGSNSYTERHRDKDRFFGENLLEVEEVTEYLGVKRTTIYRWCREGRIACLKIGKSWRIRPWAVEEFLRHRERPATLIGRLRQFLGVPAGFVSVARNTELLHRLDAAFLRVGEELGALLVKFYGDSDSSNEPRKNFESHSLDATRLESEVRLLLCTEEAPAENRGGELRHIVETHENGTETWVSFNWVEDVELDSVLRQQQQLMRHAVRQRAASRRQDRPVGRSGG